MRFKLGKKRTRNAKKQNKQSRFTPAIYDVEEIKDVFLSPLNMTSLPTWEAIDQLYDIYIVVDNALDNCVDDTLSSTDF